MPKLHEVIAHLRPDAEWSLIGEDVTQIQFLDSAILPITAEEYATAEIELIEAEAAEAAAKATAKQAVLDKLNLTAEELAAALA